MPVASARAEASGSTGSSSTVPSGAFDASTPAAAPMMPWRFSTMRVTPPSYSRVATTRTVSAVIAGSRSSACTIAALGLRHDLRGHDEDVAVGELRRARDERGEVVALRDLGQALDALDAELHGHPASLGPASILAGRGGVAARIRPWRALRGRRSGDQMSEASGTPDPTQPPAAPIAGAAGPASPVAPAYGPAAPVPAPGSADGAYGPYDAYGPVEPAYAAAGAAPTKRPIIMWDLILTIVLLVVMIGVALLASFLSFFLAFASDSCGSGITCDYDRIAPACSSR